MPELYESSQRVDSLARVVITPVHLTHTRLHYLPVSLCCRAYAYPFVQHKHSFVQHYHPFLCKSVFAFDLVCVIASKRKRSEPPSLYHTIWFLRKKKCKLRDFAYRHKTKNPSEINEIINRFRVSRPSSEDRRSTC